MKEYVIMISDQAGQMAVGILRTGQVEYGPGWAGTETCKQFWQMLADVGSQFLRPPVEDRRPS